MRLPPFRLHRPTSVERASELLLELGERAVPYCGGTELLLVAKLGFTEFTDLVDVKRIEELRGVAGDGGLRIGAATTHREIEHSELVRRQWPSLGAMERAVGNLRVRNVGTIGGNLSFADPHSDPATFLTAAGGSVTLRGGGEARRMPVEQFIVGPYATALQPGELLVSVELPRPPADAAIAHRKMSFQERPAITVAVALTLADGTVSAARIAIGSVGPRVTRGRAAEELLEGADPLAGGDELVLGAAEAAATEAAPVADANGSVEYKRQLVRVLTARAIRDALQQVAPA
jgi:aerobic carbon-monoxide dehydrogenase medium subunit